jgi:hypothetical protein
MALGMVCQGVGLAWVAAIAEPNIGFAELAPALTVAGIGTSLVFPTIANEVVASVPADDVGIASGTNSAMRELGGVFGVAVLASVFTRADVYESPAAFVDGFTAALWVGAGLTLAGVALALAVFRRPATVAERAPEPALAELAN